MTSSWDTIILFAVGLVIITLAGVVLFSNSKSRSNQSFAGICFSMVLWLVSNQLSNTMTNYETVLLLNKLIFAAITLLSYFLFYFSLTFPEDNHVFAKKRFALSIPAITVFLLSLTNLVVKDVIIKENISEVVFGSFSFLFAASFLGYVVFAFYFLVKNFVSSSGTKRQQIRFVLLGLFLSIFLGLITNLILPFIFNNFSATTFGGYFVIFFAVFTAYAILKHHLMDIKVILTETATIIVILALLVQTLLSENITRGLINGTVLVLVSFGGYLVIKSVLREIKQKEQLQTLTTQLKEANVHLKELDKTKDDFLSMASHELNTPIAAIEGYLSMILVEGLGGKIPDKARKYLDSVFQSSQRLAHLVKDLLNVSRIESDRIHIIYEESQIIDLINQAVMEIGSKVQEKHHTLTFKQAKAKMPTTWLDKTRITEVLINIIGNSVKYTPENGTIDIKVVNDDDKLVISVADNGKGIPNDRNAAVFEKFTQVDVLKDEVKGTGLGMYISKRFIELHKGKIWFHSDGAGKGTTFFFSLPIYAKKPYDRFAGEGSVLH